MAFKREVPLTCVTVCVDVRSVCGAAVCIHVESLTASDVQTLEDRARGSIHFYYTRFKVFENNTAVPQHVLPPHYYLLLFL